MDRPTPRDPGRPSVGWKHDRLWVSLIIAMYAVPLIVLALNTDYSHW